MAFDAKSTVELLKAETQMRRKRSYKRRVSRLDKFKGEIVSLRAEGASKSEIQRWLRANRIKVHFTTVSRYLEKLNG